MIAMVVLLLLIGTPIVWLVLRKRQRARLGVSLGPLAGIDTGVRSAYRVPGSRLWGPRRGF